VLTGTPLENRIEELYSIVEFVDRFRLGPMFRFLDEHQNVDGGPCGRLPQPVENLRDAPFDPHSPDERQGAQELPERMEKRFLCR